MHECLILYTVPSLSLCSLSLHPYLSLFFTCASTSPTGGTAQALERQKEYSDAIRNERDELRDEVVQLKDILKVLSHLKGVGPLNMQQWPLKQGFSIVVMQL